MVGLLLNNESERTWKVVVALSEALIWNLLGGMEEKHKNLGQGSWNPSTNIHRNHYHCSWPTKCHDTIQRIILKWISVKYIMTIKIIELTQTRVWRWILCWGSHMFLFHNMKYLQKSQFYSASTDVSFTTNSVKWIWLKNYATVWSQMTITWWHNGHNTVDYLIHIALTLTSPT